MSRPARTLAATVLAAVAIGGGSYAVMSAGGSDGPPARTAAATTTDPTVAPEADALTGQPAGAELPFAAETTKPRSPKGTGGTGNSAPPSTGAGTTPRHALDTFVPSVSGTVLTLHVGYTDTAAKVFVTWGDGEVYTYDPTMLVRGTAPTPGDLHLRHEYLNVAGTYTVSAEVQTSPTQLKRSGVITITPRKVLDPALVSATLAPLARP